MPSSLGPAEILVILVVALVVLGPKRLPEAGRHIGRFVAEVRHWSAAVQAEIRDVIDLEGEPVPPPPPGAPPAAPPAAAAPSSPVPPSPKREAGQGSAAAEWGLAERAATAPPRGPPAVVLPPEWGTPPASNGDRA